ncbi:hypothetical protein HD554DRAFT_2177728 [Boletus coccyginus]|nr:hypothetical protein HD554DRAFT_2177728 [Boletus coccyginus]
MDAHNHIIQHPQPYKTAVVFDIQSDWAEFNLLSPDTVIVPDTNNPFPDRTVATNTCVRWGKENSHQFEKKTLRFYIVNDGSLINFSISHGSKSAKSGKGRAVAIIEGGNYLNDQVTDSVWNTVWFYQKSVSATPASTTLGASLDGTQLGHGTQGVFGKD